MTSYAAETARITFMVMTGMMSWMGAAAMIIFTAEQATMF